jgi:uncharacterized protein YjbI with pentapeptide repeats
MSLLKIKRRAEGFQGDAEAFENLDLRSTKGFGSQYVGCTFTGCKMDLSDFRSSKFTNCTFIKCSMARIDMASSFIENAVFLECDLEQSSFMGTWFKEVVFKDCRMAYGEIMFQMATVNRAVTFTGCNLHGSNLDFRAVEAGELTFQDCNLWGARTAFGCAFWNANFDKATCDRFVGMIARVHPEKESQDKLEAIAGDQYRVVDRLMRTGDK